MHLSERRCLESLKSWVPFECTIVLSIVENIKIGIKMVNDTVKARCALYYEFKLRINEAIAACRKCDAFGDDV